MPDLSLRQATRQAVLTAILLSAVTLSLSGCGTLRARTQALATAPKAETSQAAPSTPENAETTAMAQAVPEQPTLTTAPLNGNPEPNSYAYRDDAKLLAQELAANLQLDPQWVWSALSQAKVKDNAAKLMMPAPAGVSKNWALYKSRFIEPIRIKAGVAFWRSNEATLQRAESQFGVPASVIAGVLGVETIYGRNTGNFRVLDVLTTLSLDFPKGRSDRSAFFKTELGQYLVLCREQGVDPTSMLGSYAGAIGLPQFMPSSIRRWAVDFDGDGHIDLANSPADAIGSVANYLREHGWQRDWPAYFNITPPTAAEPMGKLLAPDILPTFTAQEMLDLGVQLQDGGTRHPGKLALVELQNARNMPSYVAGTDNFYAVTRYNQSSYYALAVLQLGEAVSREMARQTATVCTKSACGVN
jgi:membrane-bound lytic murein transglycosylase B